MSIQCSWQKKAKTNVLRKKIKKIRLKNISKKFTHFKVGMGMIPIPSIDTVDTCELEVSIDTFTKYRLFSILTLLCLWLACMYENLNQSKEKAKKCNFFSGSMFDGIR